MDEEPPVLTERRDGRMIITLNRPRSLNAQNDPMRRALLDAFDAFDDDDGLGVLIIRAEGRAFSAGADLKEGPGDIAGGDSWDDMARRQLRMAHFARLERVRKPVIACIQGYAVGGGLELALCADLRIATLDALLGTPEARTIGGTPAIAVHRLARLIPHGEAMRILFTSQPIPAQRAYEIGLVQELTTDVEEMALVAEELADQILECRPSSIQAIKRVARWPLDSMTVQSELFAAQSGPPTQEPSTR